MPFLLNAPSCTRSSARCKCSTRKALVDEPLTPDSDMKLPLLR
jgi:hypothetical protein